MNLKSEMELLQTKRASKEQEAIESERRINKIFDVALVMLNALERLGLEQANIIAVNALKEVDTIWKSKN